MLSRLIPEKDLPETRLELRWLQGAFDRDGLRYNWSCEYHLILALWSLDIRGEVYGEDEETIKREPCKKFSLGGCYSSRSKSPLNGDHIETPFRDGAHISWDSARLGVPAYVVCDGVALHIPPAAEPPMTAREEARARRELGLPAHIEEGAAV